MPGDFHRQELSTPNDTSGKSKVGSKEVHVVPLVTAGKTKWARERLGVDDELLQNINIIHAKQLKSSKIVDTYCDILIFKHSSDNMRLKGIFLRDTFPL